MSLSLYHHTFIRHHYLFKIVVLFLCIQSVISTRITHQHHLTNKHQHVIQTSLQTQTQIQQQSQSHLPHTLALVETEAQAQAQAAAQTQAQAHTKTATDTDISADTDMSMDMNLSVSNVTALAAPQPAPNQEPNSIRLTTWQFALIAVSAFLIGIGAGTAVWYYCIAAKHQTHGTGPNAYDLFHP